MPVQISVRGRNYTFRSDDNDAELAAVARYVERKMAELSRASTDDQTVALLACLNIASEYFRYRKDTAERLEEVERELSGVGAILEASLPGAERSEGEE